MHFLTCPKCGSEYERHPLNSAAQELCPACRNEASWDSIKAVLAKAAGSVPNSIADSMAEPVQKERRMSANPEARASVFGSSGRAAQLALLAASLSSVRERGNPFAPRVPASELALVAAEAFEEASEQVEFFDSQTAPAALAPQSGATLAVAEPIRLAPDHPELPLLSVGAPAPAQALPLQFNLAPLPVTQPTPKLDFSFQLAAAPMPAIQAPDACGG